MHAHTAATTQQVAVPKVKSSARLKSIDIVRGLAMFSMLVVHTNFTTPGFEFRTHFGWNAPDFAISEPLAWLGLFFAMATPAFFLMAGFGIALFEAARRRKGWTEWQITRFLVIRGTVLIFLDFAILPWNIPSFEYEPSRYFVLLTIGLCLWSIAFLRHLDWRVLVGIAMVMTAVMQVIYYTTPMPDDVNYLRAAMAYPSPVETIKFGFPYFSWLPVMIGGFLITRYLIAHREYFTRVTLSIGSGLLVAWGIITLVNNFGVLYPDHPLVVTKHPPTLDYLTFYLGFTFLLLGTFHGVSGLQNSWIGQKLATLGQTALFFYVAHLYALIGAKEIINPFVPLEGFALAIFNVAITLPPLYIICYHYRALRKAHPNSILQYL